MNAPAATPAPPLPLPPLSPLSRRDQALARLAASRAALQVELAGPQSARDLLARSGALGPHPWRSRLATLWRYARRQSRSQPLLAGAIGVVDHWWRHHPWRAPSELAWLEMRAQLGPAVKRHPWTSVALAAAAGACVMAARPWRHRWINRQLDPLPRRIGAWLMAEIKRLPLQALLTRVLVAAASEPAPPDTHRAP